MSSPIKRFVAISTPWFFHVSKVVPMPHSTIHRGRIRVRISVKVFVSPAFVKKADWIDEIPVSHACANDDATAITVKYCKNRGNPGVIQRQHYRSNLEPSLLS